jgi:hypothetical protein
MKLLNHAITFLLAFLAVIVLSTAFDRLAEVIYAHRP